jgi:predicted DNA-binding transcriptional regulator YafY
MKLREYLERIERIDQLIRMKATGTPKELASRLQISESLLYLYIDFMKDLGAPIHYSKERKTYFYVYPVNFSLGFKIMSN